MREDLNLKGGKGSKGGNIREKQMGKKWGKEVRLKVETFFIVFFSCVYFFDSSFCQKKTM